MDTWRPAKLGELVEIKHGFAFAGEYFRDEPPGDVLLTPGNFAIGGGFKDDKFKYYVGPVPDEFVLNKGDLIVTMTDLSKAADTLGYPALVPDSKGARFLHNQRLGKVLIRHESPIRNDFLYYLLCSRPYRDEVLASATGTTVKHTAPERIKAFTFELPSLQEQAAIGHILCALDDKIDLNRRMNETLEAMARTIFKSWFVDFDPVHAKAEGRQPSGMDAATAALFPDSFEDSPLGKIPKGWRACAVGDVIEVGGGSTPSTKESGYWDGQIHWATPKDLSALRSPVLLDTERRITHAGVAQIGSRVYPEGTVLLSSRAPIGYLAISEVATAVNQGMIAMVCADNPSNHFMVHWTRENMEAIEGRASGTTFQEISKSNFRLLPLTLPTPEIMKAFTEGVESLHRRIVSNVRESNALAATRDTLLPKLISGEIRVGAHSAEVVPT